MPFQEEAMQVSLRTHVCYLLQEGVTQVSYFSYSFFYKHNDGH